MKNDGKAGDEISERLDAKKEGCDGAHDQSLIARDAHVPEWEVYARSEKNAGGTRRDLHQTHTPREVNMDQKTNWCVSVGRHTIISGLTYSIVDVCCGIEESKDRKGARECGTNLLTLPTTNQNWVI